MPTHRRAASLRGRTVLVTAGPTREHLDDVRFLTNASTGRMGLELARLAARRGARVVLVHGPVAWSPPAGVEAVGVTSTEDLHRAVKVALPSADLALFAAAPADWRPARRERGKPAREGGPLTLELLPTRDVAAAAGATKGRRVHVGFALEVEGGAGRARAKARRKRFDAIVLNSPANLGEGGGEAWWVEGDDPPAALPTASKARLAAAILDRCARLLAGRRG